MKGLWISLICMFVLFISHTSHCDEWINPKDLIKDPALARLQQGRTKLTDQEEKEIKEYGYTGLELITYVDINTRPGKCWDNFERTVVVTEGGHIKVYEWLYKEKYCYKDPVALLTLDGIKPGDIMMKTAGIYLSPPGKRYRGWLYYIYLTSEEKHAKDKEGWNWVHELRRYRRSPTTSKDDHWLGSVLTYDDIYLRRPWEEDHTIIGEDIYNGKECLVVESKNRINPDYYLSKRITWIEKKNFLDLHEEQFDKKGRRSLIIDKLWEQIKPSNYWVRSQWNCICLVTNRRIVRQSYDWRFDQHFDDGEFLPAAMGKEYLWRKSRKLQPVRHISDLPPKPQVRWEFENRLEIEKRQ